MQIEGALIWVYGVGEDGVQAFTDFGIENLIELVRLQRKTPSCSRAGNGNDPTSLRPTPDAYPARRLPAETEASRRRWPTTGNGERRCSELRSPTPPGRYGGP
ncbi:hypothetical protein XH92_34580 [Bradyrhizobium sp. CCBAU 53421]|nr:hypothetical protein XH92_34580 [Bradyrhizobium sp. CCBAU 53421]